MTNTYFSSATFKFLRELAANNNRDWFLENKNRYETDVRAPALAFIADIGPGLRKIDPNLIADPRPVGGSMFRVNRDVRFSKDKSPYKTNIGIGFGHGKAFGRPAPGLYLHVAPGESFGGGGIHMAEPSTLSAIRDAIVADTPGWKRIVEDRKFAPLFDAAEGESLKRPPQGYDPNHLFVEDLKRKSFIWHARYSEADVISAGFMAAYLETCRAGMPFTRFLSKAVGVPG